MRNLVYASFILHNKCQQARSPPPGDAPDITEITAEDAIAFHMDNDIAMLSDYHQACADAPATIDHGTIRAQLCHVLCQRFTLDEKSGRLLEKRGWDDD